MLLSVFLFFFSKKKKTFICFGICILYPVFAFFFHSFFNNIPWVFRTKAHKESYQIHKKRKKSIPQTGWFVASGVVDCINYKKTFIVKRNQSSFLLFSKIYAEIYMNSVIDLSINRVWISTFIALDVIRLVYLRWRKNWNYLFRCCCLCFSLRKEVFFFILQHDLKTCDKKLSAISSPCCQ